MCVLSNSTLFFLAARCAGICTWIDLQDWVYCSKIEMETIEKGTILVCCECTVPLQIADVQKQTTCKFKFTLWLVHQPDGSTAVLVGPA